MIVDCHTHVWDSVEQLGQGSALWDLRTRGRGPAGLPRAGVADHLAATKPVDKTIVLAFKSHYLQADIPNDFVARYVRQHIDRLVGFAAVDPTRPREALQDLRRAHGDLGLQGLTVWPAAQDFHPASTGAMRIYQEAARLQMPIMFHYHLLSAPAAKMEYARPYLIDEVAREFPTLKIIIAQMGYPWIDETLVLLGKHKNVFADISGLFHQQWQAYNALLSAYQAGVIDGLLFGSDFPYTSAATSIESVYSINLVCHGTNLPTIPREQLRQIVERNTLDLLGIEAKGKPAIREPDTAVLQADD